MPGRFVVLEGLDGSGLHEVARSMFDLFQTRYRLKDVWSTKEPSEGPVGGLLRLSLDGRLEIASQALALFFAADRMDHLFRFDGIVNRLEKGETIICDRYYLSSYAYQTSDYEPGSEEFYQRLNWLRSVNEKFARTPDLTLFIDQPPEACVRRILFEQRQLGHSQATKIVDFSDSATWEQALSRLTRVRENYRRAIDMVTSDSSRREAVQIIGTGDTELTMDQIEREMRKKLDNILK